MACRCGRAKSAATRFPPASFEFIGARDDAIGDYQTCSLFSPMLEFADHAKRGTTALLAREALFDPANAEAAELPAATSTPPPPAAARRPPGRSRGSRRSLAAPMSQARLPVRHDAGERS